ncbi:MAG: ATP-binding protein [Spirosomataceae bacterium]
MSTILHSSTQESDRRTSNKEAVEIQITDNGIGMSGRSKGQDVSTFFTTKPTGQGTGLGLSLSYDIITKGHGGTIEVSIEGEGSTFTIRIPY